MLPRPLDIPTVFFDKTIIAELKSKLELLKAVLANKIHLPDYAMQVVKYENR